MDDPAGSSAGLMLHIRPQLLDDIRDVPATRTTTAQLANCPTGSRSSGNLNPPQDVSRTSTCALS